MENLSRYVLGLALLAGCAAPSRAAQGPPAPSSAPSRRGAGTDEKFVSLQGGFSVSLPARVSSYRAVGFDVPEGRVEGDAYGWETVVLPRLGCGLGQLRWDDVKPILERYLDDRFIVLTPPEARP